MMHQILWNIQSAIRVAYPKQNLAMPWPMLCVTIERMKPHQNWTKVCQEGPIQGKTKINTDDIYIQETGEAGIGGITRDDE